MTTELSPRARRELDALAQVRGPRQAEAVLISHQRRDVGSCLCGWAELGKSHAGHQIVMLSEAGLLATPAGNEASQECEAETRSWDHFTAEQMDSYWMRCTLRGPHDEHEDEHTGFRWTDATP
jgi:hypothetical protein